MSLALASLGLFFACSGVDNVNAGQSNGSADTSTDARVDGVERAPDLQGDARYPEQVPPLEGGTPSPDVEIYNPCPPKGTTCNIMPLGDSITAGYGGTGGGYRVELFRLAHAYGQAITFVGSGRNGPLVVDGVPFPPAHEGHSGYTIDTTPAGPGILPLTANAMKMYHPHVITLMIGTNDTKVTGAPIATLAASLGNLLDSIFATDSAVLVVLAKIVPTQVDATNVQVAAYNATFEQVIAPRVASGKHITTVDMFASFTQNPNYKTELLANRLHPNDAGYAKMATTWAPAILALAPSPI